MCILRPSPPLEVMPPKKVHNALRALAISRGDDVEDDVVAYKVLAERKRTISKRGHACRVRYITSFVYVMSHDNMWYHILYKLTCGITY